MKKITFILLALISGTAFAQSNANATAAVNAEIVTPIGIQADGNALNFGTFTTSDSDGNATVILSPNGTDRTFSSNDMIIPSNTTFSVPTFTVTKDTDATYGIEIGVNQAPSLDGESLSLSNLITNLEEEGNSGNTFSVGGQLNVPSGQGAGTYTGEISVTVTYE